MRSRVALAMLVAICAQAGLPEQPVIGLTDFHGQLEQTSMTMDGRNVTVGGSAQLATMFDQEAAQLPGSSFLFASGDNVGASPANSGLLQDKPAIDVENADASHAALGNIH